MKKARVIVRVVLVILCLAAVVFSSNFVAYAIAPTYDVSEEYKGGKYYDNIRAVKLSGMVRAIRLQLRSHSLAIMRDRICQVLTDYQRTAGAIL